MSRWWPEQLQIVLHPLQVQILRMSRGRAPRILEKFIICCPAAGSNEPPWENALQTLADELPRCCHGHAQASVVLSNHFARYVIFHNSKNITRNEEELALAQHQFSRIYGQASSRWEVTLSAVEQYSHPRVACAVDQGLLGKLREICLAQRMQLLSVQPYLSAVYNQHHPSLNSNTWLALVEDGILCLAHLQDGRWQSIKTCRIASDWQRELTSLIQRESFLTGYADVTTDTPCSVMVFSPEYPKPVDISRASNTEQHAEGEAGIVLDPSQWPEPAQMAETAYAMAVFA